MMRHRLDGFPGQCRKPAYPILRLDAGTSWRALAPLRRSAPSCGPCGRELTRESTVPEYLSFRQSQQMILKKAGFEIAFHPSCRAGLRAGGCEETSGFL